MSRQDFEERKASAENTALWMKADLHRQAADGAKEVMVNLKDLMEILAYVDSVKARVQMEYAGKRLGFCRPEDMRKLMNSEVKRIFVVVRKSDTFSTAISYVDLPPKKPVDVGADTSQNVPHSDE